MFLFVNLFSFTAEAHPNPNPNSNPNPTLYMIRDQTISVFVLSCGMPALCTSSALQPSPPGPIRCGPRPPSTAAMC